jgi:hypothetical protein
MRKRVLTTALALAALGAAPNAIATPIIDLAIVPGGPANSFDMPKITLTNASDAGEQITGFSMSIGSTTFVYDFVLGPTSNPPGQAANLATETTTGATLVAGDRRNAVGSVTALVWSFSNFAPGEQLIFEVDVDRAAGPPTADARTIWFNNGAAPNAQLLLTFSNGTSASLVMPDAAPPPSSFSFGVTGVPEPGTAALLGAGLVLLAHRKPRGPRAAR